MPSKMNPEKHDTNVLVTVDEGCRGELEVIARRLEAAGAQRAGNNQQWRTIGAISSVRSRKV